ncbi:MAG: fibronectin type III domain-containing protein, partial [Propionibacteriaceae bacterium]|nr:fibronectin type III domain-containing protein [Propionibacteriaceae bacterium]
MTLRDVLASLTSMGLCDWVMDDRTLVMTNPGDLSVNLADSVRLENKLELKAAPFEETVADAAGWILVHGEDGVVATFIDDTAPARVRTWERNLNASGATTPAEALEFAAGDLELRSRPLGQHIQELVFGERTRWWPFRDYRPGDVVSAPTLGGYRAMRVQEIILSFDGQGVYGGSVILNDRLVPAELRQARTLRALVGGAGLSGTGRVPAPSRPIPKAPTGVELTSIGYWADTLPRSSVSASWAPVTESTEGRPLVVGHYRMRVSGGLETITDSASATIDGLDPRTLVQVQVAAVSDQGVQGAWSAPVSTVTAVTVSRLAPPTELMLSTGDGTCRAIWDGKLQAPPAAASPPSAEFARVRVEAAAEAEGPWVAQGSLSTAGRWIIPVTPGQTVWVRGVAVDRLGLESLPGPVSSILVGSAVAEAVAEALEQAGQAVEDATLALEGVGESVATTQQEWAVSVSDTVAPTEGWSTAQPYRPAGEYLWMRTRITRVNGTTATSAAAVVSGDQGDPGDPGATGVSVVSVVPYFVLVPSSDPAPAVPTEKPPGGAWTATEPAYVAGHQLYRVEQINYSNDTHAYTTVQKSSAYAAAVYVG